MNLKAENKMSTEPILYLSDASNTNNSVLDALRATGHEVVSTTSSAQLIALLFIMHSVAAVVLNRLSRKQNNFDVTRRLRALRPNVPILLLCRDHFEDFPRSVDACVSTQKSTKDITSEVEHLLSASLVV